MLRKPTGSVLYALHKHIGSVMTNIAAPRNAGMQNSGLWNTRVAALFVNALTATSRLNNTNGDWRGLRHKQAPETSLSTLLHAMPPFLQNSMDWAKAREGKGKGKGKTKSK